MIRVSRGPSDELGPGDVTGLLHACHTKIRASLAEARLLAKAKEWDERHRASARAVHDYFAIAFPLHVEDEDERIGPELLEHFGVEKGPLLFELHDEHARTDELRLLLLSDWARWCHEPGLASRGHQHVLKRFARSTEVHLFREEAVLFPLIDALPEPTRVTIARAMRSARQKGVSAGPPRPA
ncbi:MAG: hemerythrin domain-containing protein [Sandaracinus sp.]|nr:hemerythrin domain-containing protein [Sandaracinus sp.]MCB9619838.1 hemerythrin domain-containing protein [Sandaracinus sp.]MCB9622851.1 hemerythrin domain-containing protein [Sandaracinus sp.]